MKTSLNNKLIHYGSTEFFDVYRLEYQDVDLLFDKVNKQKIIKLKDTDGCYLYLKENSFICKGNKVLFEPIFKIFDKRINSKKY